MGKKFSQEPSLAIEARNSVEFSKATILDRTAFESHLVRQLVRCRSDGKRGSAGQYKARRPGRIIHAQMEN